MGDTYIDIPSSKMENDKNLKNVLMKLSVTVGLER